MSFRILPAFALVLLLNSCCHESVENSGIIQANLEIEGWFIQNYNCLNLPDTACIRDSSQFAEMFKITGTDADCNEIKLPEVDFLQYSVLINHKIDDDRVYYHRNVTVDSTEKIVTYLISTVSCMTVADYQVESYNLVLVPRITMDYRVEYK